MTCVFSARRMDEYRHENSSKCLLVFRGRRAPWRAPHLNQAAGSRLEFAVGKTEITDIALGWRSAVHDR